jgi:hypothetical protein
MRSAGMAHLDRRRQARTANVRQPRLCWAASMDFRGWQRDVAGALTVLFALLLFAIFCQRASFAPSTRHSCCLRGTNNILVCALDALEAVSVFLQFSSKILQSLEGLFLLGLHRLLLGELAIVVDGTRKRGERGIELCLEVWRWRCTVCKLVQVLSYRRRLTQGRVEQGVLFGCELDPLIADWVNKPCW